MTEHPIIFSGPMVRAILNDRKTMTRRVVKPQPEPSSGMGKAWRWAHHDGRRISLGPRKLVAGSLETLLESMVEYCPYGKVGDRLWVRETWKTGWGWTEPDSECIAYRADGEIRECNTHEGWLCARLRAEEGPGFAMDGQNTAGRWKPSIHMFRWASRILLEVTDVRVQRVQEISHADIHAEGVVGDTHPELGQPCRDDEQSARIYFAELWDSLNAKRGYGWDVNPWLWVIGFKRLPDIARSE
jgi:hypothetical protein